MKKSIQRFWEIDILRGIGIILVVLFHFLYDLNHFGVYKISLYTGYFLVYAYTVGSLFFLLVGVSLSLSYSKANKNSTKQHLQKKYLLRGLKVFSAGLLVTLATWIYLGDGFIIFGVLHCIGLSIILAYPFLKLRYFNIIIGFIFVFLGVTLKNLTFDFNCLLWLGFKPHSFYTVDYYPLLPWFGVVLIGIFLGNILYPSYKRRYSLKDMSQNTIIRCLGYLGRHSLIIYLLHQPILVGLFHLTML